MSVLRQSSQQFRDTLESMPPQSRLIVAAIAVAMVLGILFVAQRPHDVAKVPLFVGRSLSDHDMVLAEISFSRAGLSEWTKSEDQLLVPSAARHEYLAALEKSTVLPATFHSSVQEAIDQSHFFESDSLRHARHLHAKTQDLGNQLAAFDDICWARVVYDAGKATGFDRKVTQSASVVVCPLGRDPLPPARIHTIQQFIRGAYAGMSAEDVVVIDTNADDTFSGNTDPVARHRAEEQARIKYEVLRLLDAYGDLRVSVNVEMEQSDSAIEQTDHQRTTDKRIAVKTAAGQSDSQKTSDESEPNLFSNLFSAVTRVRGNRSAKIRVADVADEAQTPPTLAALRVQNVQVSVGIPNSYVQSVWQNQSNANAGEFRAMSDEQREQIRQTAKENIEQAVLPIIMAGSVRPKTSSVDLWIFPDSDHGTLRETNVASVWPTWVKNIANWNNAHPVLWPSLATGLVLTILSVGWLIRRRFAPRTPPVDPNLVTMHKPSDDPRETLREELVTLVDSNPDLAAQIIHSWVGKAA